MKLTYKFFKFCLIILPLILLYTKSYSQQITQTFTVAGTSTFTVPTGVISITVECWGGGGGGVHSGSGTGRRGGGGGGAYASSTVSVTTGQNIPIVVGAGGVPGASGANSSFGTSVVVAAGGGSSTDTDEFGAGGTIGNSTGTIRFSGGNGAARAPGIGGGGGSSAGTNANGTNASGITGGVAPTGGGNGGSIVAPNGQNGFAPGGGGAGRNEGGTIGNGAPGQVRITFFQTLPTHHFRTISNGNWNNRLIWQSSPDGITWIPSQAIPSNQAASILIQNGHTVALTQAETAKDITINGTLNASTFALSGTSNFILNNTLQVGGETNFPTGFTFAINNGSTVEYNRAGNQTISNRDYHNLILSNSGTKTFQSATANINGNLTINNTTTSFVRSLTIGGNVVYDGNFNVTLGAFTHNVAGNWVRNGTGTLTTTSSTINFTGSGATIGGSSTTNFNNLTISNNVGGIVLAQNQVVNGTLTLSNGLLLLGNFNLTLGMNSNPIVGSFSASNMIITNGSGELRRIYTYPGSFLFPIGDNTGTLEYSPATINVTSVSFTPNSYIGVRTTDAKHPQVTNSSNFISRFWTVSQFDILGLVYNFSGTINWSGDMVGQESLQNAVLWTGSLPFAVYSPLSGGIVTATGATQTGDFTATGLPILFSTTNSLSGFTYNVGSGPSTAQSFNISSNNLEANAIVSAPPDYEVSLTSGSGYATSLSFTPTNGVIGNPTIFVRLRTGLPVNTYSGQNITISSTGAANMLVSLTGNVTGPTVTAGTIASPLSACGAVSVPFTITDTFIIGNIFTAQLSDANGSFATPISIGTLTQTTAGTINATIPSGIMQGTGYRIRVIASNPASIGSNNGANITVQNMTPPLTFNENVCIGTTTVTLRASGATPSERYRWHSAATGGTILKTSTDNLDSIYLIPTLSSTTNYWVSKINAANCESPRTQISAIFPANSLENQLAQGTNSWIAHVYDSTNQSTTFNQNFTNYFGSFTATETFYRDFGTTCVLFNSGTDQRSILPETFSLRYRMLSTRRGLFVVNLGSDDGTRLAIDGVLVYNNWGAQSFTERPRNLISLNGNSSLVYDYFENSGGNIVQFTTLTLIIENRLTTNTFQEICIGSTSAQAIGGDVFPGTLPSGISLVGTGYQWSWSYTPTGTRTNISGATGATFTPNTGAAPFNAVGTYFVFRTTTLQSTNNTGMSSGFQQSLVSEPATIIVGTGALPTLTTTSTGSRCGPGVVTISAIPSAGVVRWFTSSTGGTPIHIGNQFTPNLTTTAHYFAEAYNSGCRSSSRTQVSAHIITPPSVSVSGASEFCTGSSINLSSTTTGSNFYWIGPNSFYSLQQNPVIPSATLAHSGTYSVIASGLSAVNLVTNGSFELGNTGFGSGYSYVVPGTNALWPEGLYTVHANPRFNHDNWSTCTPRAGSLQMIINGTGVAGTSIWNQTVNVVPNTDYQFTYWMQSVHTTSPARVQLFVNGVAAGPIHNASPTTCQQLQFYYNWNSGTSTTAYLNLVNQNTALDGNDFALDDIVFQHVCTDSASINVQVVASATPSISITSSDISCCQGSQISFQATPTFGGTTPHYQWRVNGVNTGTNSSTFVYTPSNNDVVTCVLTSNFTCRTTSNATSNSITITTYTVLTATPTLNFPIHVASTIVSGTSSPNATIFVYSNNTAANPFPVNPYTNFSISSNNKSLGTLIGTATANSSGNWTAIVSPTIQPSTIISAYSKLPSQCLSSSSNEVVTTWNPLPIELALFTAIPKDEFIEVRWATLTETNNDYFLLHRSTDGKNWNIVNKIYGAGNSNRLLNYVYYDDIDFYGTVYYKLEQFDFDGSSSSSKIISVDLAAFLQNQISTKIFPNPASSNESLFFMYNGKFQQRVNIKILSITGSILHSFVADTDEDGYLFINLELHRELQRGHYLVSIQSDLFRKTEKLIIF